MEACLEFHTRIRDGLKYLNSDICVKKRLLKGKRPILVLLSSIQTAGKVFKRS